MIRGFLHSLSGQLILLIITALAVAQAISLWLFVDERSMAVRAALGFEAAGRAANVARLIEQAPSELHPSILRAANSPLVRFDLADTPAIEESRQEDTSAVAARIRSLLGATEDRDIRVNLHQINNSIVPLPHLSGSMTQMHMAMMGGDVSTVEMSLSIALSGGQWLNVNTRFERPPLQWNLLSTASFGLTAAFILIVVIWFLLRRLIGPLRRLSLAADAFGRGENAAALPLVGPREVQELTGTFNRMQARLTRYVADRTRVLAALGHDLRSPLTALRVRAELVDDEENRERLISSIEEMQGMVEATLSFARGLAISEPVETVDLAAFLEKLREDMLGAFTLKTRDELSLRLRPNAVRRALRNLIENAARYGGGATVSFRIDDGSAVVEVQDDGPGIPEEDLERVFEPYFRLEKSRSRDTGGHGLGLSIARTIIRAHGGDLTLHNKPGGGLLAAFVLPLQNFAPDPHGANTVMQDTR